MAERSQLLADPTTDAGMRSGAGVLPFERWMVRRMLEREHCPPLRVTLWNGETIASGDGPAIVRIVLHDRGSLYRLAMDPEFQFGELYSSGRMDVEGDLVGFLEALYRVQSFDGTFATRSASRFRKLPLNSLSRARANAGHHYDLGNDFYRLWLDESMVYTCAYFPRTDVSLEAAQEAKMEHVCRKVCLRLGETVVEAGCGWGSLALYMARRYGVHVKAFNVSHEQIMLARERATAAGLGSQVEFIEDDYRNISGKFDAFVSVGMLEHVGPRHYREFGAIVNRCLTPSGRGLIHSIGRPRPMPVDSWTTTHIFPGAYVPSLGEMMDIFESNALVALDVENLRPHYAETLRHWLERFERQRDRVREMFDERFVRMWRMYLAGSRAAFLTGWMQLFQVTFSRVTNDHVPFTREHLYRHGE
ncbi:MAG: class I SAM-dependent methyltransferase [Phycisphaerales bacterium]